MFRIIKCEYCGVEFEAKTDKARFCSKKCVCKNWYQNNKEKHYEAGKQWIENNKEKFTAIQKKSREKHIERVRATGKKWREENPEKVTAAWQKWNKENPEKAKAKYKRANDKRRKILEPKKCKCCGIEFQPKRSDTEFCSTKCISVHNWKENSEKYKALNKKWIAENHERHKANKRKRFYKKLGYSEEFLEVKELQYQLKQAIKETKE